MSPPTLRLPTCRPSIQSDHPTMVGRVLRPALFAAVILALWTLARPAAAAVAPFCDDRGATALAPAPALDAPRDAMVRAPACPGASDELHATIGSPRPRMAVPTWNAVHALPALRAPPLVSSRGALLTDPSPAARSHRGVRWRVERPPRP